MRRLERRDGGLFERIRNVEDGSERRSRRAEVNVRGMDSHSHYLWPQVIGVCPFLGF